MLEWLACVSLVVLAVCLVVSPVVWSIESSRRAELVRLRGLQCPCKPDRRSNRSSKALRLGVASSQYGHCTHVGAVGTVRTAPSCPFQCVHTSDWCSADVVFAHPARTPTRLRAHPKQLWVATFWESPEHMPARPGQDFDFTMSYQPVATFPQLTMVSEQARQLPSLMGSAAAVASTVPFAQKRKRQMVSAWISNCHVEARRRGPLGRRLALMASLQRLNVSVASYGKCGRNAALPRTPPASIAALPHVREWDRAESGQKLAHAGAHLFMLAAENGDCNWYVSEKLLHALLAATVPVYYGTATAREFAPRQSTVYAAEFASASALAAYLLWLASSEARYSTMLAWRGRPTLDDRLSSKLEPPGDGVGSARWHCRVCGFLHSHGRSHVDAGRGLGCESGRWRKLISVALSGEIDEDDDVEKEEQEEGAPARSARRRPPPSERLVNAALEMAREALRLLPGWTLRVYHDARATPLWAQHELRLLDAELVDMAGASAPPAAEWAAREPSRDASVLAYLAWDSVKEPFGQREKALVEAWERRHLVERVSGNTTGDTTTRRLPGEPLGRESAQAMRVHRTSALPRAAHRPQWME